MRKQTSVLLVFLCIPLVSSLAVAQTDIQSTVDFMNQMVQPENRQVSLLPTPAQKCGVFIFSKEDVTAWLVMHNGKGGVTGFSDSGEKGWEFPRYARFDLADIDPNSIVSNSVGFSVDYIKRFFDANPECRNDGEQCKRAELSWFGPKSDDITVVAFRAIDLKPTIERGILKNAPDSCPDSRKVLGTCPKYDFEPKESIAKTGLYFRDKDRAQRFVTAFVHAVYLCGGHFAPTPERK